MGKITWGTSVDVLTEKWWWNSHSVEVFSFPQFTSEYLKGDSVDLKYPAELYFQSLISFSTNTVRKIIPC